MAWNDDDARFWEPIVRPGDEWNLEQIKLELSDYRVIITEVSRVYDDLTHGRISKPNTAAEAVIAVHDGVCDNGANYDVIEHNQVEPGMEILDEGRWVEVQRVYGSPPDTPWRTSVTLYDNAKDHPPNPYGTELYGLIPVRI
jgi:hypothetical protein